MKPITGDVSTFDMTQAPLALLLQMVNEQALVPGLPRAVLASEAIFADPFNYGADGANTRVRFSTNNPKVFGLGYWDMLYTRVNFSDIVVPADGLPIVPKGDSLSLTEVVTATSLPGLVAPDGVTVPSSGSGTKASSHTMGEAVAALNAAYGWNIAEGNVQGSFDDPLTDNGDGTVSAKILAAPSDYLYMGASLVTFKSA